MTTYTEWRDHGVCAQTDPEAFYPVVGGSTRAAKQVCRGCPVRAECLEYALEHDERFGVWGGLSVPERRRLKLRRVHAEAVQRGRQGGRKAVAR